MKSPVVILLLLGASRIALGQDEYFVDTSPDARILSKELQTNAHLSEKRFDGSEDVSRKPGWFVGSSRSETGEYHVVAYFLNPQLSYLGIFHKDHQLADLWKFSCDARQFYLEGSRLMFAMRPQQHQDTHESWMSVPREVVVDFAAMPDEGHFSFHGADYRVTR